MKKLLALVLAAFMAIIAGCGNQQSDKASSSSASSGAKDEKAAEIHVAAAASLTDAMKEIAAEYNKEHPNVKITFNFGSSGALQQAIENGGETDLFFSAAQKQMNALEKAGKLEEGTRKDLLVNEVVLIVPAKDGQDLKDFKDLTKDSVKKVAVGGEGVPVGQYTKEILEKMGLTDAVTPKEVLGSDVRQVLSWVGQGEADAGVVYATDAAISKDVKVAAKSPADSHKPVIYPAALIKDSKAKDAAKDFLAFVSGDKAKAIFVKYGFEVK